MWYRIELNNDGSVSNCTEVETKLKNGRTVHYIEAANKDEAVQRLINKWKRHRELCQVSSAKLLKARKEADICTTCGGLLGERSGSWRCAKCAARKNERKAALKAGEPLLKLPAAITPGQQLTSASGLARQQAREQAVSNSRSAARIRRGVFVLALDQFDKRSKTEYRKWLISEIAVASEIIASAREVVEAAAEAAAAAAA